ncbi:hypothetical protein D3C79_925900 [compost metagenome]
MGQNVDIVFGLQEWRIVRAIGCVQGESLILDQDAVTTFIDAGQFDNVGLLIEPAGGENGIGHAAVVGQWVETRVFHFATHFHDPHRLTQRRLCLQALDDWRQQDLPGVSHNGICCRLIGK